MSARYRMDAEHSEFTVHGFAGGLLAPKPVFAVRDFAGELGLERNMSESPRILIAGVGNIFLGDDAFGVAVVQRLSRRALPSCVRVVDFGIRGFDLACALLERYDAVILVDALPRGQTPGTLYILEPELSAVECDGPVEMHSLDPVKVLGLARSLGAPPQRLFVVGCEPASVQFSDVQPGLSEAVESSLDHAVAMVEDLTRRLLGDTGERAAMERSSLASASGSEIQP